MKGPLFKGKGLGVLSCRDEKEGIPEIKDQSRVSRGGKGVKKSVRRSSGEVEVVESEERVVGKGGGKKCGARREESSRRVAVRSVEERSEAMSRGEG
jgi:hypothetical protein